MAKNLIYTLLISGLTNFLGFSQTQTTCITIPVAPIAPKTTNTISNGIATIGAGDWILAAKTVDSKGLTVNNIGKLPTNIYIQSGELLNISIINTTSTVNIYVLAGGQLNFSSNFLLTSAISIYNYGNINLLGDLSLNGKLYNAIYSEINVAKTLSVETGQMANNGVVLVSNLTILDNAQPGAICLGPNSCLTTEVFSGNSRNGSITYNGLIGTGNYGTVNVKSSAAVFNSPIANTENIQVCLAKGVSDLSFGKNWGSATLVIDCLNTFCAKGLKELVDPNKDDFQNACEKTRPNPIKFLPASGGNGLMSYQWQSSTDARTWADIKGEIAQDYSPPILTQTTYFRRKTTSVFVVYSGIQTIRVLPAFTPTNNFIENNGYSYCGSGILTLYGSDLYQLENLVNTNFGVTYNWLSAPTQNGPWTSLGNVENSYSVSGINSTTYYRRVASSLGRCNIDTSDAVEIKIGKPLVVTRTDDNSDVLYCGMLRYAINYANNRSGLDTISFNLPSPSTISLETAIYISENIFVKGPGKDKLTIEGGRSSGIFNFNDDRRISARLEANGDTSIFTDMTYTKTIESAINFYSPTSSLIVRNCDFVKNTSYGNGAGINFYAVGLIINKCRFEDNVSGKNGGGGNGAGAYIFSTNGTVSISNSLFLTNTGTQNEGGTGIGNGNGVYLGGSKANVRIDNSSFYKNSSTNGGGIYIDPAFNDSTVIVNSTFSGNTAQYGGAIHSAGKLRLYNTTISENVATAYGGGLAIFNGNVRLKNTIIAQNTGKLSNDIFAESGLIVSNGNNFIGISNDTQGNPVWNTSTDLLGTTQSPLVAKLAALDLSTYTYMPLIGSPVIDKGSSFIGNPSLDQLGAPRRQGSTLDIGSVESTPFTFSAGNDTTTCDSIVRLKATTIPKGYTGTWGTIAADKGKATITNTTLAITTAKILKSDTVRFVWSLADQAGNILIRDTASVIRKAIPAKPTVTTPITYCQNATATPLTPNGTSFSWYTVATGGTKLAAAPTPLTTTVGTVPYYVSQTLLGCEGPRSQLNITTNIRPVSPAVITPVTYCQNATATALTATGTNLKWYTLATGGTALTAATTPLTTTVGNVNYFVSQTIGICESPRASILVTTSVTPLAPLVTTPVTYCQNATATTLTATGTNLKWYTAPTAGNALTTAPTPLTISVGNVNYYVSQTTGVCESPRATILVTTNIPPAAPIVSTPVTYCQNDVATALTATGANLKWYTLASGGTALSSAPIPLTNSIVNTSFYVSQTIGACESNRALISVRINSKPATPIITGACVTPVPPAMLSTQYVENETITTNWLKDNIIVSTNNSLSANILGIYKAFATVKSTGCKSDTSAGVDPFVTTPKIAFTGSNPFCIGDSLKVSSSSTSGNFWSFGTIQLPSTQNIVIKSAGKLVLRVTGGNCPGKDSITISTNPTPAIPLVTSIVDSACIDATIRLSTNSNTSLQWIFNGLQIKDSIKTSLQATTSGSYQVLATLGTCSSISAIKKIGFKPLPVKPVLSLAGKRSICEGDSLSVSILNYGTANGLDTWYKNGSAIAGTNSQKLKTAGVYTIVRTNKGCISNSDTLNLQVNLCAVAAFAGKDTSICTDSYKLAAAQANGYQTAWRVLKGKATFADSSANTTATKLASGVNTFVWVLKTNNKIVGSDTVNVNNNAVSKADAGSFINTCKKDTALKAAPILQGETGKWTSLGRATIANDLLATTKVSNLAPYDSINKSNKFVWTVSKGACVSKDTAEVYYSIVVITVKDTKSGFAGETIKVPVLVNDKYSLGDKLTIDSDWKKVKSLDTAFVIKDTVYFKTNAKEYLKNYSFSYFLSNQCPSARDTGVVVLNSINVKPITVPAQSVVLLAGTTKTFKIPTKYYDANPNLDSLSVELNPNSKGFLNLSFDSDSVVFDLDYSDSPTFFGQDTIKFRVWDRDENGIRSSALQSLIVTVTNKLAYAGADKTICADSITLSAAAVVGYTGSWTSLKGSSKIVNTSLPNTKVTGLATDTNIFVWTIKRNGLDAGKDTVVIVNNSTTASAGEYTHTCKPDTNLQAIAVKTGETGSWTSLGTATIANNLSINTRVSNLVPFDSVDKSNKFVWTVTKKNCISRDTAEVFYARVLITVEDIIAGYAGETIKARISSNDKYSLGDSLKITISKDLVGIGKPILDVKIDDDQDTVRFITNPRLYVKEGNRFEVVYQIENQCGISAPGRVVLNKTFNEPPTTNTFPKATESGSVYTFVLNFAEVDKNPNIRRIELLPSSPAVKGFVNARMSSDSTAAIITIDYSQVPDYEGEDYVLLRVCDEDEDGNENCADQTFIISIKGKSKDIEVYNALSPNGDGKHDFLEIKNIQLAPKNKINIFNRWGDEVYSAKDYDNDKVVFDGGTLPDGTYYYIFEPEGDRKIIKGFILLKR